MESKNYLLIARGTTTGALEKVNVITDLDTAKNILIMMMETNTHTGDFRNKPIYSYRKE